MHINQDDFKAQPINKFVVVFDSQDAVANVIPELDGLEIDSTDIEILKGDEGAAIMDADGEQSGLLGSVVRAVQTISDDSRFFKQYEEDLREGRVVAFIPGSDESKHAVANVLREHGAISIRYMGQLTTEDL